MFAELISFRTTASVAEPSSENPKFPLYLLPSSFKVNGRKRQPQDQHQNFLPAPPPTKLSRTGPSTLRCLACRTDLAFQSQIVSKGFHGRHGRAYLVSPPPPASLPTHNSAPLDPEQKKELLNTRLGPKETRQLVTGSHVVADLFCQTCDAKLGWKYVDAGEQDQKYKVGKFILETARVVVEHGLEHVEDQHHKGEKGGKLVTKRDGVNSAQEQDGDGIQFDSDDEDECDEIFAGVWDPELVAKRRNERAQAYNLPSAAGKR
ncbi:yippee-like protein [Cladorrhinum samala]|uniref:Yippee-like protein n=1 Tax=Cladorrhinum samala TaxID=585594 RepID=A0AAV9HC40_9PEZI|nr:yippee-like protein [Cladorrhinum samala]